MSDKFIFQSVYNMLYFLYSILNLILITFASILKVSIDYYADYTYVNLQVVPALLISAGSIGLGALLLLIFLTKGKHEYLMCFTVLPLKLVLQIIALIYGCIQTADRRNYLKKAVQRDMGNIFKKYHASFNLNHFFEILQDELECCGVFNYNDYGAADKLPVSCCPSENVSFLYCKNVTQAYQTGCASKVYDEITFHIGILSYSTIGFVLLEIIGGVFIAGTIWKYSKK